MKKIKYQGKIYDQIRDNMLLYISILTSLITFILSTYEEDINVQYLILCIISTIIATINCIWVDLDENDIFEVNLFFLIINLPYVFILFISNSTKWLITESFKKKIQPSISEMTITEIRAIKLKKIKKNINLKKWKIWERKKK